MKRAAPLDARFSRPRPLWRVGRATFGVLVALVAQAAACDDAAPPGVAVPDAGPACERGTRNCACIGGSGCQDDLLCIAGRCQLTEGPSEMPPPRRPRPRPQLPDVPGPGVVDAGAPAPAGDAGSPAAPDAAAPGDDAPDAASASADGG